MDPEERRQRIAELYLRIDKADRELSRLGVQPSLTQAVEAATRRLDDDGDPRVVMADLCESLVAGLNKLNEVTEEGSVVLRSDSVTIGTEVGVIEYNADDREWYFAERGR